MTYRRAVLNHLRGYFLTLGCKIGILPLPVKQ